MRKIHPLLVVASLFITAAQAAVPTQFAAVEGNAAVVQSTEIMHKGDVIEVHAFKADPGTTAVLAMCSADCSTVHPLSRIGISTRPQEAQRNVTRKITLPEDGKLFFWVELPPAAELNSNGAGGGNGSNALMTDSVHRDFSGISAAAGIAPIRKSDLDSDQIKLHYDKGCFVVVSRTSTGAN